MKTKLNRIKKVIPRLYTIITNFEIIKTQSKKYKLYVEKNASTLNTYSTSEQRLLFPHFEDKHKQQRRELNYANLGHLDRLQ